MAHNNHGGVLENLRKRLSLSVRSIQWSYAIFWSISATQPGVLEWGDGYYNGDIKTRKTIQAADNKADELGLQRSEQLRELYDSLEAGESSPQSKRPSVSLSPEDLSDTEWYYLVCMSFMFDIGQDLPGRASATGQPVWLCNASYADSKVFNRCLLAKSASIQTIVCFPFSGGAIELGTTELVMEDPSLMQMVEAFILELPYYSNDKISNKGLYNYVFFSTELFPVTGELDIASPNVSSSGFNPDYLKEDAFRIEGANGAASQLQSWKFMDDEINNEGADSSMNSSSCRSQTLIEPEKFVLPLEGEKTIDHHYLEEAISTEEHCNDDTHYQSVLSSLLKSHHQLILGPHCQQGKQGSSFTGWKKGVISLQTPNSFVPQRILKKILSEVPRKHDLRYLKHPEENAKKDGVSRPETEQILPNHILDMTERELIRERFCDLKSIIPSVCKVDQVALLDETIDYLRELKRRVDELESYPKSVLRPRKIYQEDSERTSDNCSHIRSEFSRRSPGSKRKARDPDNNEDEQDIEQRGCLTNNSLTVRIKGEDVEMTFRCVWREALLLEIMEALSNLRIDSQSVQSSNIDGVLSLKINSKFQGSANLSAGMIRRALQRVIRGS
ncbi:hypothetical protein SAY87_014473 [Trapa incisa]|uniref:BHLH domain-containing protein n=1 Tax=Trapa incisa TaxID=236973 RepID=A0AAN7GW74_9MYRT|nr:hypothetical protein SAY87_014473 [Trapa incisa]